MQHRLCHLDNELNSEAPLEQKVEAFTIESKNQKTLIIRLMLLILCDPVYPFQVHLQGLACENIVTFLRLHIWQSPTSTNQNS